MEGFILVDKPKGWTSFDVVNKVRSIVEKAGHKPKGKKRFPVGHTGTLDPLATGLMAVLLGNYTKKARELSQLDKTYDVAAKLGRISSTGDEEGDKTKVSDRKPLITEVHEVLKRFHGPIEQQPPLYSAVKVNGKRAYELARKGIKVDTKPRIVKIYELDNVLYEYPLLSFRAKVSSGTYIRSLVADIGLQLKTGAYVTQLRRTEVGPYSVTDALEIEQLTAETIYDNLQTIS